MKIVLAIFGLMLYSGLGADEAKAIRLTYRILFFTMSPGMIVRYRDKRTRTFAEGRRVKTFAGFQRKAELHLD